ncbi:hypothetical protein BD413DRAFT_468416 [Trametes elegans]|nr:hypothetical protein BD413DRAFT_468416 [Trametes elegans]
MSFSALPTEVVELILIYAAADGFAEAIAAFSQTCRAYKQLVYDSTDNHLWREIFLTTFDDPRVCGGGPGWSDTHSRDVACRQDATFDWGKTFQERFWAARHIRARTDRQEAARDIVLDETALETIRDDTRALDALISVIDTALPCPPTIVFSFLSPGDSPGGEPTPGSSYPTFPPLPQAIHRSSSNIIPVGPTDGSGRSFVQAVSARNMAWLQSALRNGYPPEVTLRLSGDRWEGGLAGQFLEKDKFSLMQSAGHLMACTGFIPVPVRDEDSARAGPASDVPPEPRAAAYMSEEMQRKRARRLARMRVYNMRYLALERHWGPFLPCVEKKARATRMAVDEDELLQPILSLFRIPGYHHHDDADEEDEEEDADGLHHDHDHDDHDNDEDDEMDEGAAEMRDADEDDDAESGEDADVVDEAMDADTSPPAEAAGERAPAFSRSNPPSPAQLRADWAYLAAVRMVVEANLREALTGGDLGGLLSLDGLRPGSAPWDASQYKAAPCGDGLDVQRDVKGKDKASGVAIDDVDAWDWAGVTGVWKRCVCWMDYRDLILHNLSGEFEDPHLAEAVRIVTMTLRITSYERSALPQYAHLPTIHFVGQTTGGSTSGQPRSVKGSVGIVADGSVRWTVQVTSVEGGEVDEWVMEGVQVGGVASAMGVLGMWTGAHHERMDPLGPFWAWKVG